MKSIHIAVLISLIFFVSRSTLADRQGTAESDAQEETLNKLLLSSSTQRWTSCPDWVRQVYLSKSGEVLFRADIVGGLSGDAAIERSVKRIAAGQSHVIRGGTLLIADRAGRLFVLNDQYQNTLIRFDPKTLAITRRYPDGADPATVQRFGGMDVSGGWLQNAWEDSTGATWFLGGCKKLGWYVHRCNNDGSWQAWKLFTDQPPTSDFPLQSPEFVEQVGNTFVLFATNGIDDPSRKAPVALRFDGNAWSAINPRVCTAENHYLAAILPNHDGSIDTLCGNGERLWTWWPDDLPGGGPPLIEKLIHSLADLDPAIRDDAQQRLARFGQRALGPIKSALNSEAPPELHSRLIRLAKLADEIDADRHKSTHDENLPYAGEWKYDTINLLTRNNHGHSAFYLDNVTNTETKESSDLAIAVVQDDGSWKVRFASHDQWTMAGWQSMTRDAFVDSQGRYWIDHGARRVDADMKMRAVSPGGLQIDDIIGEDSAGRFYFRSGQRFVILNESIDEHPGALAEKDFKMRGPYCITKDPAALMVEENNPNVLYVARNGEPKKISTDWTEGGVGLLIPLRNGNVIVLHASDVDSEFMLWDGNRWDSNKDLFSLVRKNAAIIAKNAGRTFNDFGGAQLAADGAGHIWFAHRYWQRIPDVPRPHQGDYFPQKQVDEFMYFDGSAWHDVHAELHQQHPDFTLAKLHAVAGGRSILGINGQNLVLYSYKNGKCDVQKFDTKVDFSTPPENFVDLPEGETWMTIQGRTYSIRNGVIQHEATGCPALADQDGNLWCVAQNKISVRIREAWIDCGVTGVDDSTRLIQTPDKRIWALQHEALSLVGIKKDQGKPTIKEIQRWAWSAPRSAFPGLAFDGSNYLWFSGNERDVVRLTLPSVAASK